MQRDMTLNEINVLIDQSKWDWAEAIRRVFEPRGVNAIVASDAMEALEVLDRRRIHTAIVDMESEQISGLGIIRVMRGKYPSLPCILLSNEPKGRLLSNALKLDVFSVIGKPVNMGILQEQLDRLFVKRYNSAVFGQKTESTKTGI